MNYWLILSDSVHPSSCKTASCLSHFNSPHKSINVNEIGVHIDYSIFSKADFRKTDSGLRMCIGCNLIKWKQWDHLYLEVWRELTGLLMPLGLCLCQSTTELFNQDINMCFPGTKSYRGSFYHLFLSHLRQWRKGFNLLLATCWKSLYWKEAAAAVFRSRDNDLLHYIHCNLSG